MTKQMIVLQPDWDSIPPETQMELLTNGKLDKLSWGTDYSPSSEAPHRIGDRPCSEYKQLESFVDARFPAASTHHRFDGWIVVTDGQRYPAGMPGLDFDEIWVFKCSWLPLSDEENPWREFKKLEPREKAATDLGVRDL